MTMRWYVVHAYSGFEKSVQRALEDRIRRASMQEHFGKILVPTEEVVEMKGGQKNISERKFFPGYVLVEMDMTDEAWHLVKNTAKVTGFVGGAHGRKPPPITAVPRNGSTTRALPTSSMMIMFSTPPPPSPPSSSGSDAPRMPRSAKACQHSGRQPVGDSTAAR